jgi:hypothetical protein
VASGDSWCVYALQNVILPLKSWSYDHSVYVILFASCTHFDHSPQAVTPAWFDPFIGNNHTLLLNNIRAMDDARRDGQKDDDLFYMNQASIIQSSGSGKSRLVDEVARNIFTIPFNLRPAGESKRV